MRGFTTRWVKGPRSQIEAVDKSGRTIVRLGKNGGPVIRQTVEKHRIPRSS